MDNLTSSKLSNKTSSPTQRRAPSLASTTKVYRCENAGCTNPVHLSCAQSICMEYVLKTHVNLKFVLYCTLHIMHPSPRLPDGDIVLPSWCKRVCFGPCKIYVGVDASYHRFPERPSVVEVLSQETKSPRLSQLKEYVFQLKQTIARKGRYYRDEKTQFPGTQFWMQFRGKVYICFLSREPSSSRRY